MKRVYGILAFVFSCLTIQAQIFYSNGATIQINNAATVITNGGIEITNSSDFTNDGTLTVTKNATTPFPGNFTLNTSSIVDGNGLYRIEQDWINDATFSGGTGTVELFGNTRQFITSTTSTATAFNNLQLTGSGIGINRKKTLQGVNSSTGIGGLLILADRELETQTNTFFVLNTSTGAVVHASSPGSEGFVSSLSPGFLSRVTNSNSAYLFPTGSSLGTLRYRPIEITPNTAAFNTYTVRLNNNDATVDGFDRSLNDSLECTLNNVYYHSIERATGSTSADIKMLYIPATDGTWEGMAHWKNASGDWNDLGTMALGVSATF
jgi:hypothetical protein